MFSSSPHDLLQPSHHHHSSSRHDTYASNPITIIPQPMRTITSSWLSPHIQHLANPLALPSNTGKILYWQQKTSVKKKSSPSHNKRLHPPQQIHSSCSQKQKTSFVMSTSTILLSPIISGFLLTNAKILYIQPKIKSKIFLLYHNTLLPPPQHHPLSSCPHPPSALSYSNHHLGHSKSLPTCCSRLLPLYKLHGHHITRTTRKDYGNYWTIQIEMFELWSQKGYEYISLEKT